MATKKQLIDRWEMEPWKSIVEDIQKKLVRWWEIRNDLCRKAHEKTGLYKIPPKQEPPFNTVKEIFEPLAGLPFREEVPSGRDLRSCPFPGGGFGWDYYETDFSNLTTGGHFQDSLLHRTKFDGSKALHFEFHGTYSEISFRKVHFLATNKGPGAFFSGIFRSCDFSGAKMKKAWFLEKSDLRDCSFANAILTYANFRGCDLRGCNFRCANLSGAAISGAKLDKTTDFRGTNLAGLQFEKATACFYPDQEVVFPAVDWRIANFDGSTIHD